MRFVSPDQKDVARVDVDQNDESVSSVGRFGRLKQIDFGQFVTTLANLSVLAGLLLVAVQISQGTEITRAQLANDYYLADMQLELTMMGDAPVESWLKAVYSPEEITRQDAAILDRYFNFGLVQVRRLHQMRQLGLAEDVVLTEQVDYLAWHLGNEVGRRWWAHYQSDDPDNEVVRLVDQAMQKASYSENREFIDALIPAGK